MRTAALTSERSARVLSIVEPSPRRGPTIITLGTFAVLHESNEMDSGDWQSKKSRDLLKILVARRGRPIHRESVIEMLWSGLGSPGGDNRLSVALSRARAILDPDRTMSQERFIRSVGEAIWLDIEGLDIDVFRFLDLASAGRHQLRRGSQVEAVDTLREAFQLYDGEFLEDQLYDDWAMPLREEARAAFMGVALALGSLAGQDGDYEMSVGYYTRVLDLDPYAEEALLGLVRSAQVVERHGEARRQYAAYTARMSELEIEPVAFPERHPRGSARSTSRAT